MPRIIEERDSVDIDADPHLGLVWISQISNGERDTVAVSTGDVERFIDGLRSVAAEASSDSEDESS